MLKPAPHRPAQRGVVLLVALIVLGAMILAAIALMRSTLTSNKVAGNLAFQQSATQSAEVGIEAAVNWLGSTNATDPGALYQSIKATATTVGYVALKQDPATGQSWEAYWQSTISGSGYVNALPQDSAGNTVSFVIHRLCAAAGAPPANGGCAIAPSQADSIGNSNGSDTIPFNQPIQRYYRVTARVVGPRNTLSYVQTVLAL